ncbi:HAD family hydrolase [Kribbella sandramycini]|uniref:HAD family hydrolase n=1 Tax=Kribbella sandramycini TaxID=60450 RepID=A0A7Y4P0B6_9ACTN|nr:HAD family hydrolase [Kribbella sandramycini]MBB6569189.1 putative hydrolase of the HAD superfamily [Kribbella sandramycini]NOL40970.1 HAD family hydrolase [Kribbella sandramycini]
MRRVLLSDLFSTLVPGGDAERGVLNDAMAQVLGVDAARFGREFDAAAYERFTGAYGDLGSTVRVIAQRAGGEPTDEQVHQATELRRDLTRRLLAAAPIRTLETLAKFKADGWRIGLVSNVTAETQAQWRHSLLAPYFDTVAFSAELGAAKPEPAIYLAACTALSVSPAECVYIGDGRDNELPAAASLGMHAIRTLEHANSHPAWPGPTINAFAELPALLAD